MPEDCIFCKIVNREIPSTRVYEDDKIIVIQDLNPQAPVHLLFIPTEHIVCANDIDESNSDIIAHIFTVIPQIAEELKLINGYRIVNNCGDDGGQSVKHLHFHLLGGTKLNVDMA